MRFRCALAAAFPAFVVACGSVASAQVVGTGTVKGFVVDSTRGMPLAHAFVALEGTPLGASTDSAGGFVISEVPAGTYRAALLHDRLDRMRIAVRTGAVAVPANDTLRLFLAIPSAVTVLRQRCGDSPAVTDSSALFGVVIEPDGSPAAGATVLLNWRELTISRAGVQEAERFRAAVTYPDGGFQFCGLPDDLLAEARAARGDDTSGVVPVRIPLTGVAIVELGLPERDAGTAIVQGRVFDATGAPVPDARLWLGEEAAETSSDSSGFFEFTAQRAGSQTLTVRRFGYETSEVPVLLRRGGTTHLDVVLEQYVPLGEDVVRRARRDVALERVGFALRARAGAGFHMSPEELERRDARRLSDFLVDAPMLSVTGTGSNRRVTGRREGGAGCVTYVVDGQQWSGPSPDESIEPREVGAIEVYSRGLAPALFLGIGACEVVMIWTKRHLGIDR